MHARRSVRRASRNAPETHGVRCRVPAGAFLEGPELSRTTTAVILSALLLPGAGQFYLKRYVRAGIFAAVSLASTGVILLDLLRRATFVLAQIQTGAGAPDLAQLAKWVAQAAALEGQARLALATGVLALCWAISVADACRASRCAPEPRA